MYRFSREQRTGHLKALNDESAKSAKLTSFFPTFKKLSFIRHQKLKGFFHPKHL